MSLLLPLASGFVYVAAALLLKRATELGVDVWRTVRVCNGLTAVFFAALWPLGGEIPAITQFWQPALVALLFVMGQLLTLMALRVGDVSVATPVMGLKIIFVALLTAWLIGERITPVLWIASLLATSAIGMLHFTGPAKHHHVGRTVLLAGLAGAAYAFFDVLVQKWSPAWGTGRFLPVMMGLAALYSLPFGWGGRAKNQERGEPVDWSIGRSGQAKGERKAAVRERGQTGTGWMFAGAACLGLQALMLVSSIAIYSHAAVANVLYSSRGLWSVVAVWCFGHWFGNQERNLGGRVLGWRFAGAMMLLAALVIVVFGGGRR